MTAPFLTAEWRDLLILNYQVDPALLVPRLPRGTELDLWDGKALVSLVGFRFLHTRVRGLAIPGHRDFEEINLRFYVLRRTPAGEARRGVVFIREIVPRVAIAWVARWRYGEPYRPLPMRHRVSDAQVSYWVRESGVWQEMTALPTGEWITATQRPDFAFITEHYWGYTRRSAHRTDEYEVRHAVWRVREARDIRLTLNIGSLYGPEFLPALTLPPYSALIAGGSAVEVHPGAGL
jgi:uncharacterized protein YqjF (DUF2071 family)